MTRIKITALVFTVVVLLSCSKNNTPETTNTGGNGSGGNTTTNILNLPAGWKVAAALSSSFPTGIQAFVFDTIFAGQQTKAYCLAYDSRIATIDFKPLLSATAKTPTQFFQEETGTVYGCINGGYYGGVQSFSLVKYNNVVSSANVKALNRTYNGASTPYYPTRGAFGVTGSGSPSVAWVYNIGTGNDNVYFYPSPSPNVEGQMPQVQPSAAFPIGGGPWNTVSAIGGSPVLMKNGTINITTTEELISVNNTSNRPRSAIGYTAGGIVLIMAVEGDNAPNYPGMNLASLALFMQNAGCVEALNLDGGGSASMVIANQKTVRPGDNGVERPVISALVIKKK